MFSVNVSELLLLLGAVQGLLLGGLVLYRHRSEVANRILTSMLFVYSCTLINLLVGDMGYANASANLLMIVPGLGILIGPLHYLYAKYLARPDSSFARQDWFHLAPFVLYEVALLGYTLSVGINGTGLTVDSGVERSVNFYLVFHLSLTVQFCTYLVLTLRVLRRNTAHLQNLFSTLGRKKMIWLRNITYMAIVFTAVYITELALLLTGTKLAGDFGITTVLMAIYVFVMGYMGLVNAAVFTKSYDIQQVNDSEVPKYGKSGLKPDQAKEYLDTLLFVMSQKKPYTDSHLTLKQLAEMADMTTHNLSEVINSQLKLNFFDFVNGYRVEHVKKDLLGSEKSHLTILALALDAGFNSKSSFNAIFKKHTLLTPSQFRKQNS